MRRREEGGNRRGGWHYTGGSGGIRCSLGQSYVERQSTDSWVILGQVMFKVAVVGHSQVPRRFDVEVENSEVRIYRAGGARARNFFNDERLNHVLAWRHDLTFLWLGSNDINPNTQPRELTDTILNIGKEIERNCSSTVILVEIENRQYPSSRPVIPNERYKKIKRAVNAALLKSKQFLCINFNSFVFTLGRDGVHFETSAKAQIQQKLAMNISKAKARLFGPVH